MVSYEKPGTIDLDIVESNPIVFKGKVYLMEYIRQQGINTSPSRSCHANALGCSYCRFRDLEDMSVSDPFGMVTVSAVPALTGTILL